MPAGHYGLLGLRERARLASGQLLIESATGRRHNADLDPAPAGEQRRNPMIRILIADDHLVVREGLQLILGMEEDLQVVGEAENGETAVRLAGELQPDVVLMDLRMPGIGGLRSH